MDKIVKKVVRNKNANCRDCSNSYICSLFHKSWQLDGAVSVAASEYNPSMFDDKSKRANIIGDTLCDLLPTCCGRFKDKTSNRTTVCLLTPMQKTVADKLASLSAKLQRCPTISELARELHLSRSTVHEHLDKLCEEGYVHKIKSGRRACNYTVNQESE